VSKLHAFQLPGENKVLKLLSVSKVTIAVEAWYQIVVVHSVSPI